MKTKTEVISNSTGKARVPVKAVDEERRPAAWESRPQANSRAPVRGGLAAMRNLPAAWVRYLAVSGPV